MRLMVNYNLMLLRIFCRTIKSAQLKSGWRSNSLCIPRFTIRKYYKIAQRLGNFEAIGPIQGLNKPVSDLSRGANEEDVYKLSIITAAQTLMND